MTKQTKQIPRIGFVVFNFKDLFYLFFPINALGIQIAPATQWLRT